jgi:hypothetical protein
MNVKVSGRFAAIHWDAKHLERAFTRQRPQVRESILISLLVETYMRSHRTFYQGQIVPSVSAISRLMAPSSLAPVRFA